MVNSPRSVGTQRSPGSDEVLTPRGPPLVDHWRERLVQEVDSDDAQMIRSNIARTTNVLLDDDLAKTKDIVSQLNDVYTGLEETEQRLREEVEANAQAKRKIRALETAHAKRCAAHEREEQSHARTRAKLEEEERSHTHARDLLLSTTADLESARIENEARWQASQEQLRETRAEATELRAAYIDVQLRYEGLREAYERMESERIERARHQALQDEFDRVYKQQTEAKSMLNSALFTVDAYRKECHSIQGDLEVAKINVEKHREDLARVVAEKEDLQEAKLWLEGLLKQRARVALEKQWAIEDRNHMREFLGEWRNLTRSISMARQRQDNL